MTTLHKVVFLVALLFALVWTFLLWRIARSDAPHRRLRCVHRWQRIEAHANGRAKARCLACGKVALIQLPTSPASRRP